jgi:hypothetical protein
MKKLIICLLVSGTAYAGTAFFKYEYVTGMTKQCVYDYLGSQITRTQSAVSLCPLTISTY